MNTRLAALWDRVSSGLWFLPSIMVLGATVLAWAALQVEFKLDFSNAIWWINQGNSENAGDLLASLLSSLVTMSTLVVSITMVVLTLAANQLGPRLIRSFMGDRRTQTVLGLFIGTTVYLLLIFRLLDSDLPRDAVPHFAVTLGTGLFLICVLTLLFYVHHLGRSIVADIVVNRVGDELDAAIEHNLPRPEDRTHSDAADREQGPGAPFSFTESGYVQAIDFDALCRAAARHEAQIELKFRPGHHLIAGGGHAVIRPAEALDAPLVEALVDSVAIGDERTATQDLEFSMRQLVEIALRALSPSINDPFTAIAVVDRLAASLALAMTRGEAPDTWRDDGGAVRLHAPASTFAGLAEVSFVHIRQASSEQPAVLIRMAESLAQLSETVRTRAQAATLLAHVELLEAAGRRAIAEPTDLAALIERSGLARRHLDQAGKRIGMAALPHSQ